MGKPYIITYKTNHHNEGIYEEERMLEEKSSNASGYSTSTQDTVRRFIPDALTDHEKRILRGLFNDKCKYVIFDLFEEAHEQD